MVCKRRLYGHALGEACPLRARQHGQRGSVTVTHGAAGNALDLCGRRSSGRGHFLCKQVISEEDGEEQGTRRPGPSPPSARQPKIAGPLAGH